jgi:rare lipoprotein A
MVTPMHPLLRPASSWAVIVLCALTLLACSSTPPRGAAAGRDGPGPNPPPNLAQVPDAEPRIETLRSGGPNKPYEIFGRWYTPLTGDATLSERGLASWYGRKFHGRPTSSGEP